MEQRRWLLALAYQPPFGIASLAAPHTAQKAACSVSNLFGLALTFRIKEQASAGVPEFFALHHASL
jgi:hypothetical protein